MDFLDLYLSTETVDVIYPGTSRYWVAMDATGIAKEVEVLRKWFLDCEGSGDDATGQTALKEFSRWNDLLKRVSLGGEPWLYK